MNTIKHILLGSFSVSFLSIAQAQTPQPSQGQRQGPPPQAIEACTTKVIGDQCSFTLRRGEINGQCVETPRGITTCRPEGRERGQRQQRTERQQRNTAQGERGQNNRRRPGRSHSILQSGDLTLFPANTMPIAANQVTIDVSGGNRVIQANGVAAHKTGEFPNLGNPHAIQTQQHRYTVPLYPQLSGKITKITVGQVGIAVNGVMIEPATAEVYKEARDWRYEALSGAVALGIDANYPHVQPGGLYHYHGLPTGLMKSLGVNDRQHSPLVGWAADGFPIYTLFGYKNSKNNQEGIQRESSSYRLLEGQRPGGNVPSGTPDGTFAQDYQYVASTGTLDECNGKMTVTPEYPQGTYAYFITDTFPVVPRCVKGTPSNDFRIRVAAAGNAYLF